MQRSSHFLGKGYDDTGACLISGVCSPTPSSFSVLARPGQTDEPPGWPPSLLLLAKVQQLWARAQVLRQVLPTGPCTDRGGVHEIPLQPADQAGFGHRATAVQRQHGRPHGIIHRARWVHTANLEGKVPFSKTTFFAKPELLFLRKSCPPELMHCARDVLNWLPRGLFLPLPLSFYPHQPPSSTSVTESPSLLASPCKLCARRTNGAPFS